jgi:hypothetical protein
LLALFKEIIAVYEYSEDGIKSINTLSGQNPELLNVKQVVNGVNTISNGAEV